MSNYISRLVSAWVVTILYIHCESKMRKVQFVDDGSGERILNHKILDQKHAQDKFQDFPES